MSLTIVKNTNPIFLRLEKRYFFTILDILNRFKSIAMKRNFTTNLFSIALSIITIPVFGQWDSFTTNSAYHHYAVDAVSDNVIYAGGYGGSFLKSADGGDTWDLLGIGSTDWVNAIHFEDELTGWIVACPGNTDPGDILKTTDGGNTWTSYHDQYQYSSMDWPSSSVGYAGTWEGVIVKTTDGGDTWTDLTVPSNDNIYYLYFVNESYGFAIDNNYRLYRTADGGSSWEQFFHVGISAVYFHDENNGFCVNDYGQVGTTTDGGETFTYWDSPFPEYKLHDIYFRDASYGLAVGGLDCANGICTPKPAILETRDGGVTWTSDTDHPHVGEQIGFYAIDISPNGTSFLAGSDHIMLRNAHYASIPNETNNVSLDIYPNPVSTTLTINADESVVGEQLTLTNSIGQTVKTWTLNNTTQTIDVSELASGIYVVMNETGSLRYKVVKE